MIKINLKKAPEAKSFKAILLLFLSSLGIISCDILGGGPTTEYGTPRTDFTISGKVTDESDHAIENIKVTAIEGYDNGGVFVPTSKGDAKTDGTGEFSIEVSTILVDQVRVVAEDIDGDAGGGSFATSDTLIIKKFEKIENGDGHWYMGHYISKDNVIKMKKR